MSVCSKCSKPGDFRPGHRQCRDCERAYGRVRHAARKEQAAVYRETHRDHYRKLNVENQRRKKAERHIELDRLKSAPCKDCGQTFAPYVMDFDHRDPSTKVHEVSQLINKTSAPWTRILEEVTKCDVVCVCCHRMRGWKPPKTLDSRKRLLISLKSKPCLDCGRVFHYCQMDFDHVRGLKVAGVHDLKSRAAILAEVEKCDLVCANCHRVRTQNLPKGETRNTADVLSISGHRSVKPEVQPRTKLLQELAGTAPDHTIAAQLGMIPSKVSDYRKKHGIEGFKVAVGDEPLPWHPLAGKMSDLNIERLYGVPRNTVKYYRDKLGIPVFQKYLRLSPEQAREACLNNDLMKMEKVAS